MQIILDFVKSCEYTQDYNLTCYSYCIKSKLYEKFKLKFENTVGTRHNSSPLEYRYVICKETGRPVKLDSMWQHRLTRPLHVQHTYYRIIYKQNPFNVISRGVQR